MAHYAFLDENNIVTEVIVGRNEDEVVDGISDWEEYYGSLRGQVCKRTSYSGSIRGRFAGIGFRYDPVLDVFIGFQPFPSWSLNDSGEWVPPIPYPDDQIIVDKEGNWVSGVKDYIWDEESLSWHEHEHLEELPE